MKITKIRCEICAGLSNLSEVKTRKNKAILCENHIKQLTFDPLVYNSESEKYLRGKIETEMNIPSSIKPGVNPFRRFGKEKLGKPFNTKRENIRILLLVFGIENCKEIIFGFTGKTYSSIIENKNNKKAKYWIADIIKTRFSIIFQGLEKDLETGTLIKVVDKEEINKTIIRF